MKRSFVNRMLLALVSFAVAAAAHAQDAGAAREAVRESAVALGGLDRVQAVKNITLIGYGQYAYMFGGGNITGSPDAPQKYQAANDLRRVYDLENDRFQQLERRNFLFPFAAEWGHSFAPVNTVLDGDIAYDTTPDGKVVRVGRWLENPLYLDGVHMRRMWMLNNPVALVRAALDPKTALSNQREQDGLTLIDMKLEQGDELTMAISGQSKLPAWVRWSNPQNNLGQATFATHFSGYAPYGGLLLPLGYETRLDWRNVDYFKIYVDNYLIDTQIADLAAPASVRATPEPVPPEPVVKATPVAKGVWRLTPYGTTAFEFADHIVLFELGGNQKLAKAIIDFANQLVPGKRVTTYVPSHAHFDHIAGFRVAVAEGLTVISRRGNEGIFRELAAHRAPDFPDALEKNRKPLKFRPMDEHLRLSDELMTVDLYWARGNIHMADAVFAYVPASRVMVEGDIATAALDYQFWGDDYQNLIEHYGLEVETISPVHMDIMKHADAIEMIRGGVQRARERCAAELAKGKYFPGCPIQSVRF